MSGTGLVYSSPSAPFASSSYLDGLSKVRERVRKERNYVVSGSVRMLGENNREFGILNPLEKKLRIKQQSIDSPFTVEDVESATEVCLDEKVADEIVHYRWANLQIMNKAMSTNSGHITHILFQSMNRK